MSIHNRKGHCASQIATSLLQHLSPRVSQTIKGRVLVSVAKTMPLGKTNRNIFYAADRGLSTFEDNMVQVLSAMGCRAILKSSQRVMSTITRYMQGVLFDPKKF